MTTRNIQVFVAPGNENDPLPVEASPWHRRRRVRLPYEHWSLIVAFARQIDATMADALERLSNVGASRIERQSPAELKQAEEFLREIAGRLPSALPLSEAPTESIPEAHSNQEHARMCNAVAAVFAAGAESASPIRSWVE